MNDDFEYPILLLENENQVVEPVEYQIYYNNKVQIKETKFLNNWTWI